jgi:DNA-binding NarL/FixJ family response regulator
MASPICLECMSTQCQKLPHSKHLAPREIEILLLLSKGFCNKDIANQASPRLTDGTVKVYMSHVFKKLGVENRLAAALWARDHLDLLLGASPERDLPERAA